MRKEYIYVWKELPNKLSLGRSSNAIVTLDIFFFNEATNVAHHSEMIPNCSPSKWPQNPDTVGRTQLPAPFLPLINTNDIQACKKRHFLMGDERNNVPRHGWKTKKIAGLSCWQRCNYIGATSWLMVTGDGPWDIPDWDEQSPEKDVRTRQRSAGKKNVNVPIQR